MGDQGLARSTRWGARLHFEVTPAEEGSLIRQTAIFNPRGVRGLIYWYLVCPLHALVFAGMLRGIARAAARLPDRSLVLSERDRSDPGRQA